MVWKNPSIWKLKLNWMSVYIVSHLQMGLMFLDTFLPTLPQQAHLITCSSIGHSNVTQHKMAVWSLQVAAKDAVGCNCKQRQRQAVVESDTFMSWYSVLQSGWRFHRGAGLLVQQERRLRGERKDSDDLTGCDSWQWAECSQAGHLAKQKDTNVTSMETRYVVLQVPFKCPRNTV